MFLLLVAAAGILCAGTCDLADETETKYHTAYEFTLNRIDVWLLK